MHSQRLHGALRVIVAAALALLVVLGILYATLSWRAKNTGGSSGTQTSYTEQEKLALLASLSASTTPSEKERTKILNTLQESPKQPNEAEKLEILQSLQAKP